MFIIVVYDTEQKNCAILHKFLKKYLFWNQNSVFEGTVSDAQFNEIKILLNEKRVPDSHITIYAISQEKLVQKEELGEARGNTSNIL